MTNQIKSAKGVSQSGVRLFNRALAAGYVPTATSPGPATFLRARRQQLDQRRAG